MEDSLIIPETLVKEWTQNPEDIVPDSLKQWSDSAEDLRSLYHEYKEASLRQSHLDVIRCRFMSIVFAVSPSIYAPNTGSIRGISTRMSSRQLRKLAEIIATEDTTREQIAVIKDNLVEWVHAGRRWQMMTARYGSGRMFQLGAEVDRVLSKPSIPAQYLKNVIEGYPSLPSLSELNDLGDAVLRSLAVYHPDYSNKSIGFSSGVEQQSIAADSGYHSMGFPSLSSKQYPVSGGQEQDIKPATIREHKYAYSMAPTLATVFQDIRLESLIGNLFEWVPEIEPDTCNIEDYDEVLQDLLGSFALRFGYDGSTKDYYEDMIFIHKRLRQIVQTVIHRLLGDRESGYEEDEDKSEDQVIPLTDKMNLWSDKREISDDVPDIEDNDNGDDNDDDIESRQHRDDFTLRLEGSKSFVWLRENIKNLIGLTGGSVRNKIRQSITALQPEEVHLSRGTRPEPFLLSLDLEWDLLSFIESEAKGIRRRGAKEDELISLTTVEQTITITGSAIEAQSLTCGEYLCRIWPTVGLPVLTCLKQALGAESYSYRPGDLPGIDDLAFKTGTILRADITGEIHAVAEVCEVLVWLAAALRTSHESDWLAGCRPDLTLHKTSSFTIAKVRFITTRLEIGKNGQCWHPMFNNPVVVDGFPIIRRIKGNVGLEITLNIISAISRTRQITMLNGKLYIKGFSSMLIPTVQTGDFIVWHYIYDKKGDYLAYHQDSVEHIDNIDIKMLGQYRHIIGWTSDIKIMAGRPDRCLSVKKSGLKEPPSAVAFKGFSIGISHWGVSATGTATVGNKDPGLHISFTDSIDQKLDWARQRNIVIWDTQHKRGWLLDGATVLLYMFRIWLVYWRDDSRASSLRLGELREPDYDTIRFPHAALDFFLRMDDKSGIRNLDLATFRKKVEHYEERIKGGEIKISSKTSWHTVQDRVEELVETLFQAIEHQYKLAERDGIYWKGYFAEHLEGWDFWDLATQHSHFDPITRSMACRSLPWVNFVRSIKAITLFGKGFGELFIPGQTCQRWFKLPHGNNYLAVPTERLLQIMQSFNGSPKSIPFKLSSEYVWRSLSSDYSPCWCSSLKSPITDHTLIEDTVETIHPITMFTDIKETGKRFFPHEHGAVVFGKNSKFKWYYTDGGETSKGDIPDVLDSSEDEFEDAQVEISNVRRSEAVSTAASTNPISETANNSMTQTADTSQSSGGSSGQGIHSAHENPSSMLKRPKERFNAFLRRLRNKK